MPYTNSYIMKWKSFKDEQTFTAWIEDTYSTQTLSDPDDIYTPIKGATTNPCVISYTDNDQDKFTPIRAKKCTLYFSSTNSVNFSDFASGADDRWKVTIMAGSGAQIIFIGYLVMDLLEGLFLPNPTVTTLVATDNLKTLSDIPLINDADQVPTGMDTVMHYVSWCLRQTKIDLPINLVYNIFPNGYDGAAFGPWEVIYLDAKTFEKEINELEDCFTVLEKILSGFRCYLSQHNGEWWIVGVDEFRHGTFAYYHYGVAGNFQSASTYAPHKYIGIVEDIKFRDAATIINPRRPYKSVEHQYLYEFPRELVCNINYKRGDFIADLADETVDGVVHTVKKYGIDCTNNTHSPYVPGQTSPSPTNAAYIKRLFFNDYEKQRYFVLPTTSSGTDFLEFGSFEIEPKDKVNVYIDFRWPDNQTGSNSINLASVLYVTLDGDDNTNWYLDDQGDWQSAGTGGTWSPLNGIGISWNTQDVDETSWRTIGADSKPAPVAGRIRIAVISIGNVSGSLDDRDMYYSNLSVEYLPFINGSYRTQRGESHKFSQSGNYKPKFVEQFFIWDGIRKPLKGALQTYDGSTYTLATEFYNYADGSGNGFAVDRLAKYLTNITWNQYKNLWRIFQATLQGLETTGTNPDIPDLIHNYQITDADPESTNRFFMCVGLPTQNLRECNSEVTLAETSKITDTYDYGATWEFKYLE